MRYAYCTYLSVQVLWSRAWMYSIVKWNPALSYRRNYEIFLSLCYRYVYIFTYQNTCKWEQNEDQRFNFSFLTPCRQISCSKGFNLLIQKRRRNTSPRREGYERLMFIFNKRYNTIRQYLIIIIIIQNNKCPNKCASLICCKKLQYKVKTW